MLPRVDSGHDEQTLVDVRMNDSLEKLSHLSQGSHRISIFVEHPDLPPVWGRDSVSQSVGYKGRRVLGLDDEKSPYLAGPLGAYGSPETVKIRGQPFPAAIEYEMPSRYGRGMKPIYQEETPIPLAGNNNTWVPPVAQKKGVCGVSRGIFWCTFVLVCLLIIGGAIGGLVAGVMSSVKKSQNTSNNAPLAADSTSTSLASTTSTMTLANGDVVLTTEVYTSLATIKASSTSTADSSTTTTSSSDTKSTSTSGSAPLTGPFTSSKAASAISSTSNSQPTSGAGLLSLNCPNINGSTVTTSIASTVYTYTIICNSDFHSSDLTIVNASSILDCYNACAQYTHANQKLPCAAVTFYANLTSPQASGGNCGIHGDASGLYSTGVSNTIAAAVVSDGTSVKRWFQGGLAGPWEMI